jgi:hypothetical protein
MFEIVRPVCAICLVDEHDDGQGDPRHRSAQVLEAGKMAELISPLQDDFVKVRVNNSYYAVSREELLSKSIQRDELKQ